VGVMGVVVGVGDVGGMVRLPVTVMVAVVML
jgi:hypothetical protein